MLCLQGEQRAARKESARNLLSLYYELKNEKNMIF
jgi:hypothetical protein